MMIVKYLVLLTLGFSLNGQNMIVGSVPKSGTHLLTKCLTSITGYYAIPNVQLPIVKNRRQKTDFSKLETLPEMGFYFSHIEYEPEALQVLERNNYKGFFIFRDPRDQLVSFSYWIYKHRWRWPLLAKLSHEDLITNLITSPTAYFMEQGTVKDYYDLFLPWRFDPNFCLITFEDLVGPNGGGSAEAQYAAIQKIAQHAGVAVDDAKIKEIAESLFGGTNTFRDGTIGSWKKHFTQAHKDLFKAVAGSLLIELGYEKDLSW